MKKTKTTKHQIGINANLIRLMEQYPDNFTPEETIQSLLHYMNTYSNLFAENPTPKALLVIYHELDMRMAEVAADYTLSCGKGCAHCCKMRVDVNPMEVELILAYCDENAIDIDVDYLKVQGAIPQDILDKNPGLNRCIFLAKDNSCRIYPVRPIACRKHVVISPAWLCDQRKYPAAQITSPHDYSVEIITSALDNLQGNQHDTLPKMLFAAIIKKTH
jgi:Fe-S-cluster containining protein